MPRFAFPLITRAPRACSLAALVAAFAVTAAPAAGTSLRFEGTGTDDVDRVKIRIDGPARPADVGASDFTIEFFLRARPGDNPATPCRAGNDGWIYGHVIIDRDVYGAGDRGDIGISLFADGLAFGVSDENGGETVCAPGALADDAWHHVAAVRRAGDGALLVFIDGALRAEGLGPTGDVSYRDGRTSPWPNDPFLVFGAEKHDAGVEYPSFRGWLDEVRLSDSARYASPFAPPAAPFTPDAQTAALYHLDEGSGTQVNDVSGRAGGPSHGIVRLGSSPVAPAWSGETPFAGGGGGPGRIPGARGIAGLPLVVRRNGADPNVLDMEWSASCDAADDYAIYEGPIGPTSAFTAATCTTGGALAATIVSTSFARAFVVVPLDDSSEGSYGATSAGDERPAALTPCRPTRAIAACP